MAKEFFDHIMIIVGKKKKLINKNNIMMLQVDTGYTEISMFNLDMHTIAKSLTACCKLIDREFICHFCRNLAVNINQVSNFNGDSNEITFKNGTKFILSVRQGKDLIKFLGDKMDSL